MKTFHFDDGRESTRTITVGDLKAELAKYPDEMPVFAYWEHHYTPIRNDGDDDFVIEDADGEWRGPSIRPDEHCEILSINVDPHR